MSLIRSLRGQLGIVLAFSLTLTALAQGTYQYTGPQLAERYKTNFVRLQDGRVFVASGQLTPTGSSFNTVPSSEIFDPATGNHTLAANVITPRYGAVSAVLPDGKVALIGGKTTSGYAYNIELYDPAANKFTLVGTLDYNRTDAVGVTLKDGRVLLAGGTTNAGYTSAIWLFTFSSSGVTRSGVAATVSRTGQTVTLLNDGRVLLTGGKDTYNNPLATVEIYDPVSNTLRALSNMATPRLDHAAILMKDGRVLISGGKINLSSTTTRSCEIFDPATETMSATQMISARAEHWLAVLPDGKVLIHGREYFDPTTSTFAYASTTPLKPNRTGGGAVQLQDGRVYIGGGYRIDPELPINPELFTPDGWTVNQFPVAHAGADQIIYAGTNTSASISLDGSASTDPENGALEYSWSGAFGTATGVSPTVTLPVGIHLVELAVTDSAGQRDTATVAIAVVQGVDAAAYSQMQTQVQALTAQNQELQNQLATANSQIATLTATNQQLAQKNADLAALLQSLRAAFDEIRNHATSIITISDEKKQAINAALGN